jgi:di/tricarboxylate transporter
MKGDILLIQINLKDIVSFKNDYDLLMLSDVKLSQEELTGKNHVLVEGLIPEGSSLLGLTLVDLNFRKRFDSFVLAIKRQTELLRDKVAHVNLRFSDTLLIMVSKDKLESLRESDDLIILEELDIHLKYERYWWLSILVIPMIMFLTSFKVVSITEAACLGAILLLVLRSLSMHDAYDSINWSVIFLIALLIPIGIAMDNTGAGEYISEIIVNVSTSLDLPIYKQSIAVVSILYFFTFAISAFISNAAVAIILSPLAIILGAHFSLLDPSLDPTKAFLMAICFGASTSFMTPIGYQTNLMVFAPGQYRFKDFLFAGIPLTLIFWMIATYLIPIFWPIIK